MRYRNGLRALGDCLVVAAGGLACAGAAFATGVATILMVTVPVLLLVVPALVLPLVRLLATAHRARVRRVLGEEIAGGYRPRPHRRGNWLSHRLRLLWSMASDPARWRDLRWLPANAVAGTALGLLAPALVVQGLIGVTAPLLWPALGAAPTSRTVYLFLPIDTLAGRLLAVPVGAALCWLGWWLAPRLVRAHARLTRRLLGPTRAQLRERLSAVTEARDDAVNQGATGLRQIERNLHDGVQARLVALGMGIDAAERMVGADPPAAAALLAEVRETSVAALAELRAIIRGIHPPVLADRGLSDAVRALALDLPVRADLALDLPGRPPPPVEAAAYFSVAELLGNVVKHAHADRVSIRMAHRDSALWIEVTDDGVGGAGFAGGTGLRGLRRRLAALDGVVTVSSPPGGPTAITLELPCELSSPRTSSC